MADWRDRLRGALPVPARGGVPQRPEPQTDLEAFTSDDDPFVALHYAFAHKKRAYRMPLAMGQNMNFILSEDRHQCLILGPPRCYKSTGVLAPQVLTAPGPVVSTSIKSDMYMATAVARARKGWLWHLNLNDNTGVLPGCRPLRWSPVTASKDWGRALAAGTEMAGQVKTGSVENGSYFTERASQLLSALLHAAALGGHGMDWVMTAIGGSQRTLEDAEAIIRTDGHHLAQPIIRSFVQAEGRTRDSILSTAQAATLAYQDPEGFETTVDPNFDPAEFVAGQPEWINSGVYSPHLWTLRDAGEEYFDTVEPPRGMYDTIYITASTGKQRRLAPLITALLAAIRNATFAQYERYQLGMEQQRPPVFWALDECVSIAPMADLPQTAAQAAGQGLLISIVLQDLSLAEPIWNAASKSFGTLFADQVIFPGITNIETLEAYSTLLGKEWVSREQVSMTFDPKGRKNRPSITTTTIEELLPVLEPSDIARGGQRPGDPPLDPRRVLVSKSGGQEWGWCYSMPYFNSPPFAQALVSSMDWQSRRLKVWDQRSEALVPRFGDDFEESTSNLASAGGPALVNTAIELSNRQPQLEVSQARKRQAISSIPLLKDWKGDQGFTHFEHGHGLAFLIFDRPINFQEMLQGFPVIPWQMRYYMMEAVPEAMVHWDLERAFFHAAFYASPSSVYAVLSELVQIMRVGGVVDRLPPLQNYGPTNVVVFEIADKVGNWIARRSAEQWDAAIFIPVSCNVEVRR